MIYDRIRIRRSSPHQPQPQEKTSQFTRRPFSVPPQPQPELQPQPENSELQDKIPTQSNWPGVAMFTTNRPPTSPPPRLQLKLNHELLNREKQTTKPQQTDTTKTPNNDNCPPINQPQPRKSTTGIAAPALTNSFAKAAFDYWNNPSNQNQSLKAFAEFLEKLVKEKLKLPYVLRFNFVPRPGSYGSFLPQEWTLVLNSEIFSPSLKLSAIEQKNITEMIETIYHEVRHSEQYFRVAKKLAGEGKKFTQILQLMNIPKEIAELAVKLPLANTGINKELVQEAGTWEKFLVGKYKEYSDRISLISRPMRSARLTWNNYSTINKITTIIENNKVVQSLISGLFSAIKSLQKDEFYPRIIAHIDAITSTSNQIQKLKDNVDQGQQFDFGKLERLGLCLFDKFYNAYLDLAEEKDAETTGLAAGAAFKNEAARINKK